MKKIILAVLLAAVCVAVCSCGGGDAVVTTGELTAQDGATDAVPTDVFVYDLDGTNVYVDADMAKLLETLGEPTEYFESVSCAFQGMDKVYTFGSVVIRTYPENDKDFVLAIELKDDTVSTVEGCSIGDSADAVKSVYGAAEESSEFALVYKKGESTLNFMLNDGEVTSITYLKAE